MRKDSLIIFLVVMVFTTNISTIFAQEIYTSQEILSATWGNASDQIGLIEGMEERLPVGPASFAVDDNGSIYILDVVNQKMKKGEHQFPERGRLVSNIHVEKDGIDIAVDLEKSIFVLYPKYLEKYAPIDGRLLKKYRVASGDGVISGIIAHKKGVLSIITGDQKSYNIQEVKRSSQSHQFISKSGIRSTFTTCSYVTKKINKHKGIVKNLTSNSEFEVNADNPLASIVFIDTDKLNNIFISVETFLGGPTVNVKREIRKYNQNGELLAILNLDMNYHTFPNKDIVIDKNGNIYQMQPLAGGVKILKWKSN